MIQGIVFDLGSTLIRFTCAWGDIRQESQSELVRALAAEGLAPDPAALLDHFGAAMEAYTAQRELDQRERTTFVVLREVLAECGVEVPEEASLRRALAAMYAVSEACWEPEPGVHALLERLAGSYRLGMISNASDDDNVQRLLDKADLRRFFDPILVSAALGIRKPAEQPFRALLASWQLPAEQTVMIGDTLDADILGAQRVGMRQIWLTTEAGRSDNLAQAGRIVPEATVARLEQIPEALGELYEAPPPDA